MHLPRRSGKVVSSTECKESMAALGQRKQFALDTNLLYDLASEEDFAHTLREIFQERGYQLLIPPTVIQEITFASCKKTGEGRELALKSLCSMRSWGLEPFDLIAVGHGITERFAQELIHKGILPDSELNDGLILAETALAGIPLLVTSDSHLLALDSGVLAGCFADSDLRQVSIAHPKPLLRAMKRT